ncbi:sigma-E factor negative regulatory protein [Acidihalobacter ferrooxydans]|nr:sigma-E factor negative regulatory protein [Acidihalobacter ferrooxydans]
MTTTMNRQDEHLSALVDGEAGRFEARRMMDELLSDAQLRERWARYHLIGDALRQERPLFADAGFAAGVMARVEAEAAQKPAALPRWAKPLAGFALTASVAGAMVLGLQSVTVPVGSGLQPASQPTAMVVPQAGVDPGHHVPTQLESYMRMNGYLLSHVEQSGAGAVMPYARLVSDTPGK